MYRWYVINTYSGHENKVKHNLEHRVQTMSQNRNVRQVVVPTEDLMEVGKDGQKEPKAKRTMPGYVLVNMEMTDDAWGLVKNTPVVTAFVAEYFGGTQDGLGQRSAKSFVASRSAAGLAFVLAACLLGLTFYLVSLAAELAPYELVSSDSASRDGH